MVISPAKRISPMSVPHRLLESHAVPVAYNQTSSLPSVGTNLHDKNARGCVAPLSQHGNILLAFKAVLRYHFFPNPKES
jgi:hypothetical protein